MAHMLPSRMIFFFFWGQNSIPTIMIFFVAAVVMGCGGGSYYGWFFFFLLCGLIFGWELTMVVVVGFECCGGDGLQVVVGVVGFICGWREKETERKREKLPWVRRETVKKRDKYEMNKRVNSVVFMWKIRIGMLGEF